jgi:hypothetical protein
VPHSRSVEAYWRLSPNQAASGAVRLDNGQTVALSERSFGILISGAGEGAQFHGAKATELKGVIRWKEKKPVILIRNY